MLGSGEQHASRSRQGYVTLWHNGVNIVMLWVIKFFTWLRQFDIAWTCVVDSGA